MFATFCVYFVYDFYTNNNNNNNRKSHMGFRLVPNSVTLNGVMAVIYLSKTDALCSSRWRSFLLF